MSKNTKILLKRSTVAGKAPTADIMESGEAFVNLAKGTEHLYFKNAANEVIATKLGPLDKELNETSENGVENQAIAKKYDELKKQLDSIALTYSVYGFARVNGDNSPAGTIFFGKDSHLEEITSHVHMGLTTKDGTLYKKCANCRLDLAADGTELKIDGTDGDVMLFVDSKLYFLKGTVPAPADLNLGVDGIELNIIAFGMVPFSIYGVNAKAFDPFAFNPQYTVNCQIPGVDNVECAHSIYNPAYAGSYDSAFAAFNETFKANGNGYPSFGITAMDSIWYAQGKNADQTTNRPYMGGYYEFYEIFIALMFCELKSVYHQDVKSFGTGCTRLEQSKSTFDLATNFYSTYGYSGVMLAIKRGQLGNYFIPFGLSDYRIATPSAPDTFVPLYTELIMAGTNVFTEMLEPIRVLNDIAKAGLISRIWDAKTETSTNKDVLFEYDEAGNMMVSDINANEVTDDYPHTNVLIPNHKYYQVRNVPGIKGMADGVMTAVVNIYIRMTFKDGFTMRDHLNNTYNLTAGYAVYKFSHPVYRGMCLLDGLPSQLQGCHYVNTCIKGSVASGHVYVNYFKCAENVDDIPAQQAQSIEYFGDKDKELEIERGLTKVVQTHGALILPVKEDENIWAKKADYNASLLCYTQGGGSISTGECAYLQNNASDGNEDTETNENGLPVGGRKCVNAVFVGCLADSDLLSARAVNGSYSASLYSESPSSGRFSIPHLSLINVGISDED